jgi:transcriptional antiterminator
MNIQSYTNHSIICYDVLVNLNFGAKNMKKKDICIEIISILLVAKKPIIIEHIAGKIGVSNKTIRNYMESDNFNTMLGHCKIVKKQNVGVVLEGTDLDKNSIKQKIDEFNHGNSSYVPQISLHERQAYILGILFRNRSTYTTQLFADELYVSKTTIVNDLINIEDWLVSHNLKLKKKQNQGLWISGNETNCRKAMKELFFDRNIKIKLMKDTFDFEILDKIDYRINLNFFKRFIHFFPEINILHIQQILGAAEQKLGFYFTDECFASLILHITVSVIRMKNGKILGEIKNMETVCFTPEFFLAKDMVTALTSNYKILVPESEEISLCLQLLTSQRQVECNSTAYFNQIYQKYATLVKKLITNISNQLAIELIDDDRLLKGLALHLDVAIRRSKLGVNPENPMLDKIKVQFTSIYVSVLTCIRELEVDENITLNEDEVGYIVLHIGAAIERKKRKNKYNTFIICASGIGTSQLVASRLAREFEELNIIDVLPVFEINENLIKKVDIIISTLRLPFKDEKIIIINNWVDKFDILTIRNYIEKHPLSTGNKETFETKLYIEKDLIFFENKLIHKETLLKKYAAILEERGYVLSGYFESMLARECRASTSIGGKGVAIPHGQEDLIIKPGIMVIRTDKPCNWNEDYVDLIFILAIKFQDIKETRSFFKTFFKILDDDILLKNLRLLKSEAEFEKVFKVSGDGSEAYGLVTADH